MALYRFELARRCIIQEYYVVEADTQEQAEDMVFSGEIDRAGEEFVEYIDQRFRLCQKPELLDPLYTMVKQYDESQ